VDRQISVKHTQLSAPFPLPLYGDFRATWTIYMKL
jgi:hypothetical protein